MEKSSMLSKQAQTDLEISKLNFYDLDLKKLLGNVSNRNHYGCMLYYVHHPRTNELLVVCDQSQFEYLEEIKQLIKDAKHRCKILHIWTMYFNNLNVKTPRSFYTALKQMDIFLAIDFLQTFYERPIRIELLLENLSLNISVKDLNQNLNEILIAKLLTL